jgi:hypothetical protein
VATFARVHLQPVDNSGVSGAATFEEVDGRMRVVLHVEGLPKPGSTYLVHVHRGTCTGGEADGSHEHGGGAQHGQEEAAHAEGHGDHMNTGGSMTEIEAPLTPVEADAEGRGSSTMVLHDATVDGLFSGEPEYVNVHAAGSGNPPPLACANLGGGRTSELRSAR